MSHHFWKIISDKAFKVAHCKISDSPLTVYRRITVQNGSLWVSMQQIWMILHWCCVGLVLQWLPMALAVYQGLFQLLSSKYLSASFLYLSVDCLSYRPWPQRGALPLLPTVKHWILAWTVWQSLYLERRLELKLILPVHGDLGWLVWSSVFLTPKAMLDDKDMPCVFLLDTFSRLLAKISFSSDDAANVPFSVSLTVCCSPQLPAAAAHHVVWKPLRLTAAIHSCEVPGCLWSLHRPALPCYRLLDCSLQQGTGFQWFALLILTLRLSLLFCTYCCKFLTFSGLLSSLFPFFLILYFQLVERYCGTYTWNSGKTQRTA